MTPPSEPLAPRSPVRYWQEAEGWWAEDDTMPPGWTGVADTLDEVLRLHAEARLIVPLTRELDATRERLRVAETRIAKAPQVECACHPGVRWPIECWGKECEITVTKRERDAARSECERLREALAQLDAAVDQGVNHGGIYRDDPDWWGRIGKALDVSSAALAPAPSPVAQATDPRGSGNPGGGDV